ncbi:MAG TPA: hypothetical protein VJV22_08720 [Acidobacteriaceae bacterium]|nr:hypothetical protein [Acidobacteriaceae bacterium]
MPGTAATAIPEEVEVVASARSDDLLTLSAIAVFAFIITDVLCESGRAAVALLTISPAGRLSSIGWSSAYDNVWVDASGAAIGLIAALVFCILFRSFKTSGWSTRLFLLLCCAFAALSGAGYFVVAGFTDFGDWYTRLQGLHRWTALSVSLVIGGAMVYGLALFALSRGFGQLFTERQRVRRILLISWRAAILVYLCSAVLNPGGRGEIALSSLPIVTISDFGLFFVSLFLPRRASAAGEVAKLDRSFAWIGTSAVCALLFIFVLGRGLMLSR